MLFGSDGLGLQFHDAKDAQFIGMVALSIILFSGGMDTKFREIKPILGPGIVLSTVGVLLTALFTGLFIWWLSGMSWTNIYLPITTSLLLASTMSSTDSASVFAILRSQKMNLKHNLRPMLELESGSNDPMAYMLTIVLIQFIQSAGMGVEMCIRDSINTIHIEIPPLRERKEDIVPLAERFIIRFCKQYDKEPMKFSPAAKEKLTAHPWYGNIRELEHAIEKVVIINDGLQIPAELFQLSSRKTETSEKNISTLEEMEVQMIRKALDACAGNLSAVAAQLGITRQTLYNKMKKFGL